MVNERTSSRDRAERQAGELGTCAVPASDAVACPICSSVRLDLAYDFPRAERAEDVPGRVLRCADCSMWFKVVSDPNGIPTSYPGECGTDEVAATYLLGDTARALFRDMLAKLNAGTGATRPRLLDIGAGQGALVEEAGRLGFEAEGVDHCASNVEAAAARGLTMRLGAAEALGDRDAFDVITMMDLIEHVSDPRRLLEFAHAALKPGGDLVVYTPNHRAMIVVVAKLLARAGIMQPVREIFGRNHVAFFDDRTLSELLRRVGFEIVTCRLFRYDPTRPGQYISPLNLMVLSAMEWLGTPIDRVFRMLVYARKRRA